MWATITAMVLLAPPTGFTSSMERIMLKSTGKELPTVSVDALEARLTVTHAKVQGTFDSQLCPTIKKTADGFTLECSTRRLWAGLVADERTLALDLRALRGVAWEGDAALPAKAWPMNAVGITDECPGRLEATKAECAYARGDYEEAERLYKRTRSGPDASLAYLRLGDLAMRREDPETAVHLYAFVPTVGPVGRIAKSRLCDLTGSCLAEADSVATGDAFGMTEPLKSELRLAYFRRELSMGRDARLLTDFTADLSRNPELCDDTVALCQKILIAGMRSPDETVRATALNGWLNDTLRHGPYEVELAMIAAQAAEELGAPVFAATVLTSISHRVPKDALSAHLRRVIELYLSGRDSIRAGVILEYAEGTLGASMNSTEWRKLKRRVEQGTHPARAVVPVAEVKKPALSTAELESGVGTLRDLARATQARSRAAEPDHD